MNADPEVSTLVAMLPPAPAGQGEGSADHPYPAYIRAAVCAFGGDARPLPAVLVDLSLGRAGIEVYGEFEAQAFWLRFDWHDWECCFECRIVSKLPVGQHTFVQATFAGLNGEASDFLRGIVDTLAQQFEASQKRLAQTRARRMRDLRASIGDGSYRSDPRAVARNILNQVTRGSKHQ